MRNAILITLVSILVISLITIGAVYALPSQPPGELLPSSVPEAASSEDPSTYPYLLRAYEGKLGVFTTDLVQPDMVFDVYVKTLPEYDQRELEKGVRVETFDKLNALIEDYIS